MPNHEKYQKNILNKEEKVKLKNSEVGVKKNVSKGSLNSQIRGVVRLLKRVRFN